MNKYIAINMSFNEFMMEILIYWQCVNIFRLFMSCNCAMIELLTGCIVICFFFNSSVDYLVLICVVILYLQKVCAGENVTVTL